MNIPEPVHSAFSDAIESGDTDLVRGFLKQHPGLVNHPEWTPPPLHCAILWNRPEMVELLLDHGADIEMLDPDRDTTPIRYAIVFGKKQVIPLLVSKGANVGPVTEKGTTALQLAKDAADGAFESFDDTPSVEVYREIVTLLGELGIDA